MRIILKIFLPVLLTTLLVFLPLIISPSLLVGRGNDLTEFFWPIIFFVKNNILSLHQVPFWNTLFFSGTPLLSDPQNPIWYLPNIIFLGLPIDQGFLITFLIHTILGGIGTYYVAKNLNLSRTASIFAACLFIASPKLAGYLEAGHYGLIISYAWFPWIILSTIKIAKNPTAKWSVFLALGLAAIYFNHVLTVIITIPAIICLWLALPKINFKRSFLYFILAGTLTIGLVAVAFLPQNEWQKQTTRDLLLQHPDVYPKWLGKKDFLKSIFIGNTETEKIIVLGIVPSMLAVVGFFKMRRIHKILLILGVSLITLITLNNVSPINQILMNQSWYVLFRVSTRSWFIIVLISIFLAARGLENILALKKGFLSKIKYPILFLAILELLFYGYKITTKPVLTDTNKAPDAVYEFLRKDPGNFRVFCTTRCLSQKKSALNGLSLAEGYGTLQQKNYFQAGMQIGQYYWDRYSLAIPPFEIYRYQKLQPQAQIISKYNIKYVVSPHSLTDKNLVFLSAFDKFSVYQNNLYGAPNYEIYSPNLIRIKTNHSDSTSLTIPEIYNSNWKAYLDGKYPTPTSETKDGTISVALSSQTRFVDLKYQSEIGKIGAIISLLTVISVVILFLKVHPQQKVVLLTLATALVLRLTHLMPWLEDWDSVQFALGLHNFDPSINQPHAPGYPIYILIGKFIYLFSQNDTLALTLTSCIFGVVVIYLTYLLATKMFNKNTGIFAAILAAVIPIGWMMSISALTNITGLAFLSFFALLLYQARGRQRILVSLLAGFILGIRFTELPVIVSLLVLAHLKDFNIKHTIASVFSFFVGIALWMIPSALVTGTDGFINSYKWIAGYVIHHDSLIDQKIPLYVSVVSRLKQLFYLLEVSYGKIFLLLAAIAVIFLVLRKQIQKNFSVLFLVVWLFSYLLPLIFIFNLEVPRYTLPLLPPLVIISSYLMSIMYDKNKTLTTIVLVFVAALLFRQGYSQVTRFVNNTPPTIKAVEYIDQNLSPEDTLILSSYTYRQLQYYLPQFENYYDNSPSPERFKNKKYIVFDYAGLKEKIPNNYQLKLANQVEFTGDRDIFTRIPKTTIYIGELSVIH